MPAAGAVGVARLRLGGFTMIEMLAVMVVVGLLLGVALDFYIDLSRQATRATELTRGMRRAHAVLDHVATDLEHALLVKKPEAVDPLAHPWIFLGEPVHAQNGSDRLKFVRRAAPRASDGSGAHLALVSYTLRRSEENPEAWTLRRWTSPELPEVLDREFPLEGDPDELLLADGVASFAMRFLDATTGEWLTRWDSSLIEASSRLPLAVEIEVTLVDDPLLAGDDDRFGEEPVPYLRRVRLPVRPLDLEALLDPGDGGEELAGADDEIDPDLTVADCLDPSDVAEIADLFGTSVEEAEVYYARSAGMAWADAVAQAPALADLGFCP